MIPLYSRIKERFLDSNENFYLVFLQQLEIQSGVSEVKEEGSGSHPDALIRTCLKGLLQTLSGRKNEALATMLRNLPQERRHMDASHLADLIARAIQYLFRQNQDSSYVDFDADQWEHYFTTLTEAQVATIREILITKEVATHVLARYRSLTALDVLYYQKKRMPLRVSDIGCSLNLGLRAAVKGTILQKDLSNFTDRTAHQLILHALKAEKPPIDYALGIDIQEPDFDWVTACAYFSKYDENRSTLQGYRDLIEQDTHNGFHITSIVGDITDAQTIQTIQTEHCPNFNVMFASMVLYQLSPSMVNSALHNIKNILAPDGLFAELTFKNPRNWFLPWNTVTTVRFKEGDELSQPYQWLEWDNSRCTIVQEGKDFQEVNLRLFNL